MNLQVQDALPTVMARLRVMDPSTCDFAEAGPWKWYRGLGV